MNDSLLSTILAGVGISLACWLGKAGLNVAVSQLKSFVILQLGGTNSKIDEQAIEIKAIKGVVQRMQDDLDTFAKLAIADRMRGSDGLNQSMNAVKNHLDDRLLALARGEPWINEQTTIKGEKR